MKKVLFAMGCVSAAVATPKWQELESYTFDKYVSDFGFGAGFASEARKTTFEQNLLKIQLHNLRQSTYKENVNKFTALTKDEMKKFKGYNSAKTPSKPKSLFMLATPTPVASSKQPKSLDWRTKGAVSKIKNQGGCGSCWAFAATETIESHVQIASGKLLELSPQQITACTPNPNQCGGKGGCLGATAELAFDYIHKNGGIATSVDYPYTAAGGTTGSCITKNITKVATVTGFHKNKENDVDTLMAAVQLGPVSISVDAGAWFGYNSGIYDNCNKNAIIDHAVQLVGYGEDAGVKYWTVRNSWGEEWGESGYIRVKRFTSSTAFCGIDNKNKDGNGCKGGPKKTKVCGMCGILSDTSYPLGAKLVKNGEATLFDQLV